MDLTHVVLAHISGIPVEEVLLPLVYGGGAVWAAVRVAASRRRKRSEPRAGPVYRRASSLVGTARLGSMAGVVVSRAQARRLF